ncbi:MmgE/PrpD family protein [Chloroflexota bacterium]
MKKVSEVLSQFATELHYKDLSPEVISYSKQLILDTIGVAFGGYLSEPSRITRIVVKELGGHPESTIIGSGDKTSCSLAALANGVMVRYLDFMDIYYTIDAIHPSENIPLALAVGEREHSSGKDILLAVFLGFEFQGRLADTFPFPKLGWHQVTTGGYVTPFVAGNLLGLNKEQMVNAMGIASCTSHTLDYNIGSISMIKALGYGLAAQKGIQAALLAQKGMTGPDNVMELFNETIKLNADLSPVLKGGDKPRILKSAIKPYASEYMTHTPLEAMYAIVEEQGLKSEDVDSMHLKIYEFAMQLADEECYQPKTRERADHSLPYCLAVGLIEGDIGPEQFAHEQWRDAKVLDLMSRIKVGLDPEMDKIYPKARPADLEIRTKSGKVYRKRVDYPKGDPNNPMSDKEVQAKFRKLAEPLMGKKQVQSIIDTVNSLENLEDVGYLMELMVV